MVSILTRPKNGRSYAHKKRPAQPGSALFQTGTGESVLGRTTPLHQIDEEGEMG